MRNVGGKIPHIERPHVPFCPTLLFRNVYLGVSAVNLLVRDLALPLAAGERGLVHRVAAYACG